MKILIQGAMEGEIDYFLNYFNPQNHQIIAGYNFYIANYKNNTIIISLTGIGIINATMSTTIAIEKFSPDIVINQGCAGAHIWNLNIGDIVIGEKSVYINDFVSTPKNEGEGSNCFEWTPNKKRSYLISSTDKYIAIAKKLICKNNVTIGILGSGDVFSREVDRIKYLNSIFGHVCEDMESVAVLKVCDNYNVDRIAFRIISNNELLSTAFNEAVCQDLQQFVINFIDIL